MVENTDLMLTQRGNWSSARIKYTLRLVSYITPETMIQKIGRYLSPKQKKMSENQWKKTIGAKGPQGDKYFDLLVQKNIMIPKGTENNEDRYYDIYRLDKKRLAQEIKESEVGEEILDASKFVVNQIIEGRTVSWEI